MGNRKIGKSVQVSIFDKDFQRLPVLRDGDEELGNISKPSNFSEMLMISEWLSKDFPHVRIDLYNTAENVWFGEMTFYNASGYMKYIPDRFDYDIGAKFDLPI